MWVLITLKLFFVDIVILSYCCYLGTSCGGGVGTEFSVVDSSCRSEVTALAVGRDELELLIGNRVGQAKRYDPSTKTYKKALTGLAGTGAVVGLGVVGTIHTHC